MYMHVFVHFLQVEVHCGDRGRSLARVWNAFVSTVEATSVELRNEKARLEAANAALLAEMAAQQRELKGMDFLRCAASGGKHLASCAARL